MDIANEPGSDQAEAREALREARRAEDAVRFPRTPYWFFLLNAVLLAALPLTPLLADRATAALVTVGVAVIAINLLAARKAGVLGAASAPPGLTAAMIGAFAVIMGALFLYDLIAQLWVVIIAAVIVFGLVLLGGRSYQRRSATS